jgi:MYXO-CTERM domain-containing protein
MNPSMDPPMTADDAPVGVSPLGSVGSSGGCSIEPGSGSRSGSRAAALFALLAAGLLRRRRSS